MIPKLLTGMLLLFGAVGGGGCREPELPSTVTSDADHEHDWEGVDGKLRNWNAGGPYLYATSVAPVADLWKWSDGRLERLMERVPVDASQPYDMFAWRDQLYQIRKRAFAQRLVARSVTLDETQEVDVGLFWYLISRATLSGNGRYVGMMLTEEQNRNPHWESDWRKRTVMLAVYDPGQGTFRKAIVVGGQGLGVRRVMPSDCGRYVAAAGWRNGILVVDVEEDRVLWEERPPSEVNTTDVCWSPDGTVLYSVGSEGCLYRHDARTGDVLDRWWATTTDRSEYGWRISTVAVSPDGRYVAAGTGPTGLVFLWDAQTGRRLGVFDHCYSTILLLSFSPDSRHLASFEGSVIKIWKLPEPTGDEVEAKPAPIADGHGAPSD